MPEAMIAVRRFTSVSTARSKVARDRGPLDGELADCFPLAKPTLAGHFSVSREAELVMSEKSGTTTTYRLNVSVLGEAPLGLFGLAKALSALQGVLGEARLAAGAADPVLTSLCAMKRAGRCCTRR